MYLVLAVVSYFAMTLSNWIVAVIAIGVIAFLMFVLDKETSIIKAMLVIVVAVGCGITYDQIGNQYPLFTERMYQTVIPLGVLLVAVTGWEVVYDGWKALKQLNAGTYAVLLYAGLGSIALMAISSQKAVAAAGSWDPTNTVATWGTVFFHGAWGIAAVVSAALCGTLTKIKKGK